MRKQNHILKKKQLFKGYGCFTGQSCDILSVADTVKPVRNDHLYNKFYYL